MWLFTRGLASHLLVGGELLLLAPTGLGPLLTEVDRSHIQLESIVTASDTQALLSRLSIWIVGTGTSFIKLVVSARALRSLGRSSGHDVFSWLYGCKAFLKELL